MLALAVVHVLTAIKVSKSGAWQLEGEWPFGHWADPGLADAVGCLVGTGTLLDVGAGVGEYGAHFGGCAAERAPRWSGIDGTPNVTRLASSGPGGLVVSHANFCVRSDPKLRVHDWLMSIEVGEHLPPPCVKGFVKMLVDHSRLGIVLSWAHHGQPGRGHVSPRSSTEVAAMLAVHGWARDENATLQIYRMAQVHYIGVNAAVFRPQPLLRQIAAQAKRVLKRNPDTQCWAANRDKCAARLRREHPSGTTLIHRMCECTRACTCPRPLQLRPLET